jgi:hypothetical protein
MEYTFIAYVASSNKLTLEKQKLYEARRTKKVPLCIF